MWRIILAENLGTIIAWPSLSLALYLAGLPMPRVAVIAGLTLLALHCTFFDWQNARK